MSGQQWEPVTYENCRHIEGPFYHGTKAHLEPGALLVPGHASNYENGRISRHIYFSALLDPAIWGAELATRLTGDAGRGHIYIVEPQGVFEDDPNVTNKRFPGNPMRSYRTRHPLRILAEVTEWEGHSPEVLQGMLKHLDTLRANGRALIED